MSNTSDNGGTTSTEYRYKYLMSAVALLVLVSFITLIVLATIGVASLSIIPQVWFLTYITLVLGAATWLWGIDLFHKSPFGK